jgi:hypothetical protein
MTNLNITEENVKAAHKAGCADVKKVLDNLFPDTFKMEVSTFGIEGTPAQKMWAKNLGTESYQFMHSRGSGEYKNKGLYLGVDRNIIFKVVRDTEGAQVLIVEKA